MPFDASADVDPITAYRMKTRDRMIALRNYIAELPPANFKMSTWYAHTFDKAANTCGTCACIGGWAALLFELYHDEVSKTPCINTEIVGQHLGLSSHNAWALFYPPGRLNTGSREFDAYQATPAQAVKVLDHYLETGAINWRVAFE